MYPCDPIEVNGMINLDFDADGVLIGIEVLDARSKLPRHVLDAARRLDTATCETTFGEYAAGYGGSGPVPGGAVSARRHPCRCRGGSAAGHGRHGSGRVGRGSRPSPDFDVSHETSARVWAARKDQAPQRPLV
ncbi:DUF2283 domain-containing protein [Streptomyces bobili]|uniref:DUF2283 domain-containing protein n=1 Tax=Streptomyces bobili TaxID=67280 RepID=UPI0037006788